MLTLEETAWSLKAFKVFSILNILPIRVDVKSGKIQKQSSPMKILMNKILFGLGISHSLYMFGRLVQSTVIEPEKYFRWDHVVMHFGLTFGYAVWDFLGLYLFEENLEEVVLIFNHLFLEREDPVQKMIDVQVKMQKQMKSSPGNSKENRDCGSGGKSGTEISTSARPQSKDQGENQNGNEDIEDQPETQVSPRPLMGWPLQYSLDELMAKQFPILVVYYGFFILLILAVDPTRPQLLYSSLPTEYQNVWTLLILMAVEGISMAVAFCTCSFAIVTQILFFGKCQCEFKRMNLQLRNLHEKFQNRSLANGGRELETEIWILRQILEEMRELVVLVELFNRCFPFCIFPFKNYALSNCILYYFFTIRYFLDFPVLAIFVAYCAVGLTLTYTIVYANAFSIPGKMDELKNAFLLTAQRTTSKFIGNKSFQSEMTKGIGAIRGVGIKVGSFHQMERESTPNFIDFVVNQVVSLLVTFPR